MKTLAFILSLSSLGITLPAMAKNLQEISNHTARNFVESTSESGQFEIASSEMALEKSSDPDVRAFAQMMIDDHTSADHQLQEIIAGTPLAANLKSILKPNHQKIYESLKKTSGKEFDQKYIQAQLEAHQEAVHLFREYSQSGDTASLRDFARRELPILENHQTHAHQLKSG